MSKLIKTKASGRICFFGDHQDYLSLPVIAGTIDRFIKIEGKLNGEKALILNLIDFDSQVKIDFSLHHSRNMRIEILNLTGQLQDIILNDRLGTGEHSIIWTAADIAAGVYFIRLSSKGISKIKKVVLLK